MKCIHKQVHRAAYMNFDTGKIHLSQFETGKEVIHRASWCIRGMKIPTFIFHVYGWHCEKCYKDTSLKHLH